MRFYTTRLMAICGMVGLIGGCTSIPATVNDPKLTTENVSALRVATWNVEHLAFPIDKGCKPRYEHELVALQSYAQGINADIVGLQEVASYEAVNLLFPESEWTIIVSDRPDSDPYKCRGSGFTSTQQKVAFAVRKSLSIKAVRHLNEFGLDSPGLRFGLEIKVKLDNLQSNQPASFSVLNLHMKSGCFVDNYSRSESDACQTFSRQAPILDRWVDDKERQQQPYFIVGDFNHRLSAPYNHLTQALHTDAKGDRNSLVNTGAQLIGCHPYYPAPIDHIFAGKLESAGWEYETQIIPFEDMQVDAMLSDHCAVVAEFEQQMLPISNSVKWQTQSKEYQTIALGTYQVAQQSLIRIDKPNTPWVVVMDIDETVLDNSAYQVARDSTGTRYTSESWATWVKSEKATLTPGAAEFISTALNQGAKLALVTNRDATLNAYTWRNLLAQGLPLTNQNTCLLGRSQADIDAVDERTILNDKDLRRAQVAAGDAACFNPENNSTDWNSGHSIVMQIGDNIEDFAGVTQEHVEVDSVLIELNKTLFLLPNPMYGSW